MLYDWLRGSFNQYAWQSNGARFVARYVSLTQQIFDLMSNALK